MAEQHPVKEADVVDFHDIEHEQEALLAVGNGGQIFLRREAEEALILNERNAAV